MTKKLITLLLISALPLFGAMAYMSLPEDTAIELLASGTDWLIIILSVLIFISVLRMFSYLNTLQEILLKNKAEEAGLSQIEVPSRANWWTAFYARITDAVPVEDEEQIMTDHEYDGIVELDNNLPPWWKAGFYLGIVFAAVYLMRFHVLKLEPLSAESYVIEMKEAEESIQEYLANAKDLVDENNVQYLTDATALTNGAKIFAQNCAVCHAADGGGGVGPNLTDPYWKHGGSIVDVFSTIKYGVPTMGMIAWKDNLRPGELQEVASFVLSMQGETPAKPKEAEGELYVPASDALAVAE